ncbi:MULTISPECIES: hypothetical protein [unclassified Microbacterium]|uniref:hypothetical protein n=1 Tax=unclassified Microbacterium TaxID=2609290 RepID=UPI0011AF2E32|nr:MULTISPECIES: hypothetical protein [unclassified Microbacterium]
MFEATGTDAIHRIKNPPGIRGMGPSRNPDIEINVETGDVGIEGGDGNVVDNIDEYLDPHSSPSPIGPSIDWGPLVAVGVGVLLVGVAGNAVKAPGTG